MQRSSKKYFDVRCERTLKVKIITVPAKGSGTARVVGIFSLRYSHFVKVITVQIAKWRYYLAVSAVERSLSV